jgi:hypothetical protein
MVRGLAEAAVFPEEARARDHETTQRGRRVAELLRVVSQALAELAREFEATHQNVTPRARTRRRRARDVAVPANVTDIDVQAARRALRRAGL